MLAFAGGATGRLTILLPVSTQSACFFNVFGLFPSHKDFSVIRYHVCAQTGRMEQVETIDWKKDRRFAANTVEPYKKKDGERDMRRRCHDACFWRCRTCPTAICPEAPMLANITPARLELALQGSSLVDQKTRYFNCATCTMAGNHITINLATAKLMDATRRNASAAEVFFAYFCRTLSLFCLTHFHLLPLSGT